MQIKIPSYEVVLELHDIVLEESGGRKGVLHPNVIDGALGRPLNYMAYETHDLHTICSLLLDSLARNHAFVEGNKRTALITVLYTYRLNDVYLSFTDMTNEDFEKLVLWVVKSKPSIPKIEEKLKKLITKYQKRGISRLAEIIRSQGETTE